jgi:pimeloyl-ACP methyl ester carboxylesterase
MNARQLIFSTVLFTATFASAGPIVWLHGWNSDGALWKDLQAQMVKKTYATTNDFLTLSYYSGSDGGLGFTTGTPIEEVAQGAAREIMNFYEVRNDGMPIDVVAHSMGGLVFRSMIAQQCFVDNSIFDRYITLGTPHYGQNATISYQAQQMKYGSNFLWHLGEAWHFDGKRWPGQDTLCIVGITDFILESNTSSGSYWDGLVHAWSAALGGDVPVRYVYRSHSSSLESVVYASAPALCSCVDGEDDAVFRMICNFLDDGSVPESLTPTYGGTHDNIEELPRWAEKERSLWSLFAQVHWASNCAPMSYSAGKDIMHTYVVDKTELKPSVEYGSGGASGYGEGIFQIFGNLPTGGVHGVALYRPGKTNPFVPTDPIIPEPGSCRLMRFYDAPDPALVATAAGQTVSVPISWLSATGLVANVESLADCSNKLATATGNGYTGAECWYYGVNPLDADDRAWLRATGLTVTNGSAILGFPVRDAPWDRVHVQRASSLPGPFADVADSELVRDDGVVSIAAPDPSGFYRLFVR